MPSSTPNLGVPYPLPADALVDYPTTGRGLAELLDSLVGSGLRKLWDSVDAGVVLPSVSIVTPTLDQRARHLLISYRARSGYGASSEAFCLRFNGVTSANYFSQLIKGAGAAASGVERLAAAYGLHVGDVAAANAGSPNHAGSGLVLIPDYARDAGLFREVVAVNGCAFGTGTGQLAAHAAFGQLILSSAIQTIEFKTLNGAGIVAGSRFSVYGIGGP